MRFPAGNTSLNTFCCRELQPVILLPNILTQLYGNRPSIGIAGVTGNGPSWLEGATGTPNLDCLNGCIPLITLNPMERVPKLVTKKEVNRLRRGQTFSHHCPAILSLESLEVLSQARRACENSVDYVLQFRGLAEIGVEGVLARHSADQGTITSRAISSLRIFPIWFFRLVLLRKNRNCSCGNWNAGKR
jgi:hypothetical protein